MNTNRKLVVEPIGLDITRLARPINWRELFGNDHPVEVEIGMGKGTFLTGQAAAHPERNFLGIEWASWYWRYASDRLRRHECLNARAVRAEASFFLDEYVSSESVNVLHIYFPDPWPKARHHKRRLIQEKFMPKVERILQVGGRLQVVTDHLDYWNQIEKVVRASNLKIVEYIRADSARDGEFVGTNFERKFIEEGRKFYAMAGEKGT